jgi:hypothetical protein
MTGKSFGQTCCRRLHWLLVSGMAAACSWGVAPVIVVAEEELGPLWAYQPVIPPVADAADPRSLIDQLIERALPEGLELAGPADRDELIRRATFDLTGLPPTPDEVAAYVTDPRDDDTAFAALIERLLASPHYGERMAQHWLDVVRYADSSGLANDYHRGNAWRYRDYVVRAFRDDTPFDRFILEQIAGDELAPADPEAVIATGFLRMGPWELTGMEVAQVARQRFLDDVTNSVGETFLAHSLQCARCHDHMFDPVPTRDYYSIQAVFATTQLAEREAAWLPEENTGSFERQRFLAQRREAYRQTLADLDRVLLANALAWYADRGLEDARWRAIVAEVSAKQSTGIFDAARRRIGKECEEGEYPPKLVGFTTEQFGLERVARKGLQRLDFEEETYEPFALAVYDGPTPELKSVNAPLRVPKGDAAKATEAAADQTCVLVGGDPFSPGEAVEPGVLSVLGDLLEAPIPQTTEGRRLALARWIADPRNPLTTRTIANRVWMWHFGRPLSGNPNNFGDSGARPTHPQLLDALADRLVKNGWSLKSLHRLIMQSDAYRRSSEHPRPELLQEHDPQGTSYAVFLPRRLSAEELRDAMLAVSGELNPEIGGPPCYPEINREVALQPRQVMGTFAAAWTPDPLPEDRHRRTLYACRLRGLADPFVEVFNAPPADFSCERREASNVTPQVFALLNSERMGLRSLAFADRCLRESSSDPEAIHRCYQLAYGREPSDRETQRMLDAWQQIEQGLPETAEPWEPWPQIVEREAVEENTGDAFRFTETLHEIAEFVPDLQPADVDRHTRALADLCLAILNSNEFLYVY